uniref:Uncharacterized protein n=1 Tax=Caenorhabditis japonica TaxID=281687 RepID=A0A8R1E003_CAEJA
MIINRSTVLLFIIAFFGCVYAQEWNRKKDYYRKANCGLRPLPLAEDKQYLELTEEDYMVTVTSRGQDGEVGSERAFGGMYVSTRHIFASASAIMNNQSRWLFDNELWDKKLCRNNHLIVPQKYVQEIVVRPGHCVTSSCVSVLKPVKRAIVFNMCKSIVERNFALSYATLFLEMTEDISKNYACIADNNINITVGEDLHQYSFEYETHDKKHAQLIYQKRDVQHWKGKHDKYVQLGNKKNLTTGSRGGILMKFTEGRWWLFAISSINKRSYAIDVRNYQDTLCRLKVCGRTKKGEKMPDPIVQTTNEPVATTESTTSTPTTTTTEYIEPTEPVTFAKPATRPSMIEVKPEPVQMIENTSPVIPLQEEVPVKSPAVDSEPRKMDKDADADDDDDDNEDKPAEVGQYVDGAGAFTLLTCCVVASLYFFFTF